MTEQHNDDITAPTPAVPDGTPVATESTSTQPAATDTTAYQPSPARKWLVGAVLVTAGLVAGSGATYALTAQASPAQGQFSNSQGFPGGGYGRMGGGQGGGMGGPPGSTDGTTGQQGTRPSGAPSAQTG